MGVVSDVDIIRIAQQYGELAGPEALAEVSGYDVRHCRRFIKAPPKNRINRGNRDLLIGNLKTMLARIAELRREKQEIARVLHGAAGAIGAGSGRAEVARKEHEDGKATPGTETGS